MAAKLCVINAKNIVLQRLLLFLDFGSVASVRHTFTNNFCNNFEHAIIQSFGSNEKYRAVETIKTIRNVDIKLNEGKMVFQCEKSAYSSLKMVLLVFFFFFL